MTQLSTVGDKTLRYDKRTDENGQVAITLPDHLYAQGVAFDRCVAGETEPDYVGPHRATVQSKALMANLGLSELSARHRLPPQVLLAHQSPSIGRAESVESGQESERLLLHRPLPQLQILPQPQPQPKPNSSNRLYVKVDGIRNSYQDLQPYVHADSDARPSERLWVTYSPGTVREVIPNEVFQYSPYISVAHLASSASVSAPASILGHGTGPPSDTGHHTRSHASDTGHGPDSSSPMSPGGTGTDFFLQRYQRMSTVYQDTASMSRALGNAMYDSSARKKRGKEMNVDSGIGTSEDQHQLSATTTTSATTREFITGAHPNVVLDIPPPTNTSQEQTPRHAAPSPPRVLFGPRLNTAQQTSLAPNPSQARLSSPILPKPSPSPSTEGHQQRSFVVFADPSP